MTEVRGAPTVAPRALRWAIVLALVWAAGQLVLSELDDHPKSPIRTGAFFSQALCEGDFDTAAKLASPSLLRGREPEPFGRAMLARSGCSGSVLNWEGVADHARDALVHVRLELGGGHELVKRLRVRETPDGWRVVAYASHDGRWPPSALWPERLDGRTGRPPSLPQQPAGPPPPGPIG